MIRYPVSPTDLERAVDAHKPNWRTRAADKTATFRALGHFEDSSDIWSEIKPVFVELQGGGKCAYCERLLESEAYGLVEHDIEHFRPKGRVTAWAVPATITKAGATPTAVPTAGHGYYLLPYSLANYAVSCKTCNSTLKKDRFPIAGTYDLTGTDPVGMAATERPFLLFPIGDDGDDAETFIGFNGDQPFARAPTGTHDHHRALVTIAFFRLDDRRRTNLFKERARLLIGLNTALAYLALAPADDPDRAVAEATVAQARDPTSAHASCARSFARLFQTDRATARAFAKAAADWLATKS